MRKHWKLVLILVAWAVMLLGLGFTILMDREVEDKQQGQEVSSRPYHVETPYFSLILPAGWEFEELPGIDSYIAIIRGENVAVIVDYGASSDPLEGYEDGLDYSVDYVLVGNYMPKIVVSRQDKGVTGIHFAQLPDDQKLTLVTSNVGLLTKNLVLSMFYSIRINHAANPDVKPE